MAGSDVKANSTTSTGSNVVLFGGTIRLKGFIATPTANAGTVTFADNNVTIFSITTAASVASGPISISIPDEGIKFGTKLQANLANVAGLTVFFA